MCGVSLQPAQAQREVDFFFGIANEIIRQGVQNDQVKREQTQRAQQQRAAEQAALAEKQAYELEFYTRTQTALKTLGFYQMTVDGQTGPGTRAAIAAYQSAFRLAGSFDENALYDLEWRAAEGWRSVDEISAAQAGGFTDRDEFAKAQQGGFTTAPSYQAARAKGFDNAADFKSFVGSGAASKTEFEAQKTRAAAADAAVETCFTSTQSQDWGEALSACYAASLAKPSDNSAALALEKALAGAQQGLDEGRARLAQKRSELAKLLDGATGDASQDARNVRVEVNALADELLFIELHLQSGQCGALIARESWDEAAATCAVDVKVDHLAGDKREQAEVLLAAIGQQADLADEKVKMAEAAVAAEAARLALGDARATAAQLLANVEAHGAQGHQFEKGLEVAREIVALRGAAEGKDAALIKRHASALEALLGADEAYVMAQRALADARQQTERTAALEARRQAEMINDFILAYVSGNVTSSHVPTLLPLAESLGSALSEGNSERIIAAQAQARSTLGQLDLDGALASFAAAYKAPQVSAEQLESVDAEMANASLALETALADADGLIDAIDSFAKAGGAFTDPIAVARGLARLKTAMATPSLPDLSLLHDALLSVVEADPVYASATQLRDQSNDVSLANSIALATEELTGINDFLLGYIAANVTADDILAAVDLQLSVETTLSSPASAETVRSLARVKDQLADNSLADHFAAFAARQSASLKTAGAALSTNGLAITPANAVLLEGDADDLLVLRNSAAPHLAYDLLGNLRVDGGVADLCWLHPAPQNILSLLMARQQLASQGVPNLDVSHCEAPLEHADLAVLRRADFLALPPSVATPLIAAFEDGRFKLIVSVSGVEAARASDRLTAEAAALAVRVGNGTATGFGLLQMTNGRGGICAAVSDVAPHGTSLSLHADTLAFYFAEPQVSSPMTTERAFVGAQRGQCSGIYAAANELRSMAEALERADIAFAFAPIWIERADIEAEATRLTQESARQVQEAEAAAALLAAQTADQRSELARRQEALRADYTERATGAQKEIAEIVREMVQTGKSQTLAEMFPDMNKHLRALTASKWVVTDTSDTLADYGTAIWQGREIEAILVRVVTQRENAILGLYAQDCVILGYLVDREFRINRDPIEASCANRAKIADWTTGRTMHSVWNIVETP